MHLVDSYLHEVARFLPASQRADVVGELRATIEEEIGERASSHGGAPTREDEAAVLSRFGHPFKVASGYQSRRYVIGPDLYPAFLQTLSTLLVVVVALQFVAALALAAGTGWTISLPGLLEGLVESVFWVAVVVTLVFVALEGAGRRLTWYDRWEPASLGAGAASVVDRGEVVTGLITEGVFLLWWNEALVLGGWLTAWSDAGGAVALSLGAAWSPWFWPLNALVGASFLLHAFVLARGLWHRPTLVAEIGLGAATLAVAIWLLWQDGALVAVSGPLEPYAVASVARAVSDEPPATCRCSLANAAVTSCAAIP